MKNTNNSNEQIIKKCKALIRSITRKNSPTNGPLIEFIESTTSYRTFFLAELLSYFSKPMTAIINDQGENKVLEACVTCLKIRDCVIEKKKEKFATLLKKWILKKGEIFLLNLIKEDTDLLDNLINFYFYIAVEYYLRNQETAFLKMDSKSIKELENQVLKILIYLKLQEGERDILVIYDAEYGQSGFESVNENPNSYEKKHLEYCKNELSRLFDAHLKKMNDISSANYLNKTRMITGIYEAFFKGISVAVSFEINNTYKDTEIAEDFPIFYKIRKFNPFTKGKKTTKENKHLYSIIYKLCLLIEESNPNRITQKEICNWFKVKPSTYSQNVNSPLRKADRARWKQELNNNGEKEKLNDYLNKIVKKRNE